MLLLQILDWEKPVAQVQGKGHGVIPVHTLNPSQTTAETREEENGMVATSACTTKEQECTNYIPPCAESVMADVDSSKVLRNDSSQSHGSYKTYPLFSTTAEPQIHRSSNCASR